MIGSRQPDGTATRAHRSADKKMKLCAPSHRHFVSSLAWLCPAFRKLIRSRTKKTARTMPTATSHWRQQRSRSTKTARLSAVPGRAADPPAGALRRCCRRGNEKGDVHGGEAAPVDRDPGPDQQHRCANRSDQIGQDHSAKKETACFGADCSVLSLENEFPPIPERRNRPRP